MLFEWSKFYADSSFRFYFITRSNAATLGLCRITCIYSCSMSVYTMIPPGRKRPLDFITHPIFRHEDWGTPCIFMIQYYFNFHDCLLASESRRMFFMFTISCTENCSTLLCDAWWNIFFHYFIKQFIILIFSENKNLVYICD